MKLRTRIIAWLHILCDVPAILFVLMLTAVGGGVLTGAIKSDKPEALAERYLGGSIVLGFALLATIVILLDILPWICLLKKRRWAWWYLTIVFGIATSTVLLCWIPIPKPGSELTRAIWGSALILWDFGITFVILITDRPKGRKTPTRRRRRRSTSAATTTRRRRTRRRRSTYDY